jgi:DMSO/TMAO reductase YedYZ molybdopterin-dependent catalytic subunit
MNDGKSHLGDHAVPIARAEIASRAVFIAYGVNGEPLPEKHGFPMREVAEGRYGSPWTRYLYRLEAVTRLSKAQHADIGLF